MHTMRAVPLVVYAALAAVLFTRNGIPLSDDRVIAWLVGGLFCVCIALRIGRWRRLVLDWLPLAVALTAYDALRGGLSGRVPIHSEAQIAFARHLFGDVGSVWLQARLWDPAHVHWYDYASFFTYLSYFLVTPTVLAVLWLRRPELFARYVRLLLGMWFVALAFFLLLPTIPPWLASAKGMIGPVTRLVGPIGTHVPLFDPATLWERGMRLANDLAAFPSLHEGMTILLAVFFWARSRAWVRVLLAAYPLAMAFALVYTGEHYVADLLGGVLLVAGVVAVEKRLPQLRSVRGARLADRVGPGPARALVADDQPAVRAGAAHDWVRP
jgi:membrane-associated phospholipid phosphatase